MLKGRATAVALVLFAALFAYGLVQLVRLRVAAGDVYPEYSSLRSDPLGTKAFFESLRQLHGPAVERFYLPMDKIPDGRGTSLFILGLHPINLDADREELRRLENFVRLGGRLVISLRPAFDRLSLDGMTGPSTQRGRGAGEHARRIKLGEAWDFRLALQPLEQFKDRGYAPVPVSLDAALALPTNVLWHSAVVFAGTEPSWRTIYLRGTNAVLMERTLGNGTIVLASDSFFTSNEALLRERHSALLAWLAGPNARVLFDETHLGVMETRGVADLARKYRLHGAVAGLLALAGLFIWKNSVSFVPRTGPGPAGEHIAGFDAASGFARLLRRNVPVADLINLCWDEWQKTFARERGRSRAAAEAERLLRDANASRATQRDPVGTYKAITNVLKTRTQEQKTPSITHEHRTA